MTACAVSRALLRSRGRLRQGFRRAPGAAADGDLRGRRGSLRLRPGSGDALGMAPAAALFRRPDAEALIASVYLSRASTASEKGLKRALFGLFRCCERTCELGVAKVKVDWDPGPFRGLTEPIRGLIPTVKSRRGGLQHLGSACYRGAPRPEGLADREPMGEKAFGVAPVPRRPGCAWTERPGLRNVDARATGSVGFGAMTWFNAALHKHRDLRVMLETHARAEDYRDMAPSSEKPAEGVCPQVANAGPSRTASDWVVIHRRATCREPRSPRPRSRQRRIKAYKPEHLNDIPWIPTPARFRALGRPSCNNRREVRGRHHDSSCVPETLGVCRQPANLENLVESATCSTSEDWSADAPARRRQRLSLRGRRS